MRLIGTFFLVVLFACSVQAVTNSADLAVQITSPQTIITNGQTATYYVQAINYGPENISADDACEVQFLPPAGQYSGTPVTSGPGTISYDTNGIVIWHPGGINSGQSATMTVTVTINTQDETLNAAETGDVYYDNSTNYDPDSGNNYASLELPLKPAADLSIIISDNYSTNTWSIDNGTYQIDVTVSNAGPTVVTNLAVTNILPAGATYSIDAPSDASQYSFNGNILTWWPGGNYLYANSMELMVINITPTNTGEKTVTSTLYSPADTTANNNMATHTMYVTTPPVTVTLGINSWDIVPTVNRYGTIEYHLHIFNNGADNAENVIVSNTLPPDTIFEKTSSVSQGTVTNNGDGTITWFVGTMTNSGSEADMQFNVRPLNSGTITNITEIFSDADINEATNSFTSETTVINPGPDICTVLSPNYTNPTMNTAYFAAMIETNGVIVTNIPVTIQVTRGPHIYTTATNTTALHPEIPELTNAVALFDITDNSGYPGIDYVTLSGNAGIIPFSTQTKFYWEMMDTQTYTNGTTGYVTNGLSTFTIDITDDFTIQGIGVGLLMYHSWPKNLEVRLTSPDNTTVELWSESTNMMPGNGADGMWIGTSNNMCILTDDADTNIIDAAEPFAGNFTTESLTLSNFVGESCQGTWTLEIEDMYPEDNKGGSLFAWGLGISPYDGDADNDGMNDSWESAHGLDPNDPTDANGDSDHDGSPNWKEFRTGGNPSDPSDAFSMNSGSGVPMVDENKITITWRSQSNAFYTVEQSSDLLADFTAILTGIEATPPTNTVVITNSVSGIPFFYRVIQEE